jgi:hypothetical protein
LHAKVFKRFFKIFFSVISALHSRHNFGSREVAKMAGIEHSKLIRKLEGDSKHIGIIPTLTKAQMGAGAY